MNEAERERMEGELLEYLHGCHAEPAALERRLEAEPELRELLEEVRGLATVLEEAAIEPASELQLVPPRERRAPFFVRGMAIAASVIFALCLLAPGAAWGVMKLRADAASADSLRLVVSAPRGVPDGTAARVHVDTWNVDGGSVATRVSWTAFDGEGAELARGAADSSGSFDVDLPANLPGLRRVVVSAARGGKERRAELELAPQADAPLAHLTTDKPAYKPGETVFVRAVVLDRMTLKAHDGTCHLRVVDAKGTVAWSHWPELLEGAGDGRWQIPADAKGGEYTLELRDTQDELAAESLPFLVRAYQPPRLAKQVELDRETYAPGERGTAEVVCARSEGGVPVGARVDATLVVDGAEVWSASGELDEEGAAAFEFEVPEEVERGEARFVARVTDGGTVETAIEPFVVPTGAVAVDFYPEGGELVAGLENRVYAEVRDPLGRELSARGRVVDARGREVAAFDTAHQGRARFAFTPRAGERYTLELDEPPASPIELPAASAHGAAKGVALRASEDVTPVGAPLRIDVTSTGPGPFVAGVFLRGALVAQDTFEGAGEHALSIALPDEVAGVLRVTVFDSSLRPLAERLVARESGRAISVEVRPARARLMPGEHQTLELVARDERGAPVAAMLGLAVSDRAVRDMVGGARVGLADQTWLCADVEELEEVEEFLAHDDESRRNVDLLLGTRGWRRFAWFDAGALLAEYGDAAKRLLVREGRAQVPQVLDLAGDDRAALASVRRSARDVGEVAFGLGALGVLLLAMLFVARGVWIVPALRGRGALRPVAVGTAVVWVGAAALLFFGLTGGPMMRLRAPGAFERELVAGMEAPPEELFEDGAVWEGRQGVWRGSIIDLDGFGAGTGNPEFLLGRGQSRDDGAPVFFGANLDEMIELEEEPPALQGLGYAQDELPEVEGRLGDEELERYERIYVAQRVYAHRNARTPGMPRTDFTETVYWHPLLKTALDGTARVEFDLSDRVTTWDVHVDAHGAGRVGQARASFEAVPPFRMEAKLPVELTAGDRLLLPVALASEAGGPATARVIANLRGPLRLAGEAQREVELVDGRGRVLLPVEVLPGDGEGFVGLAGEARGFVDRVVQPVRVAPRGFPQHDSMSGVVRDVAELDVGLPAEWVEGSLSIELVLYPSPLAEILQGMEGMLQQPGGCFEQASRSNYPNVLALAYLEAAGEDVSPVAARAERLLDSGYELLTGYECSEQGYEWFGGDPGHEALTAYGLLQFHDMAQVYPVDDGMLGRTREWLLARRDGQGGYQRNERALDSFGQAPQPVTDAYCTFSLVVTGSDPAELRDELGRAAVRAVESADPYELALCAGALEAAGRTHEADAARERLKGLQAEDGSLVGTTSSITRSGGDDLAVETTSLAVLAWLADPADEAHVQRAVQFLLSQRDGRGTFGATQATVMALKALTRYACTNRRIANAGELTVFVNDYPVETLGFEAGQRGALRLAGLGEHLKPGGNRVRLQLTGGNEFPWALDVRYTADQPADAPQARVAIEAELSSARVEEGRTVALAAAVENLTDEGQPMTIAILGLPAGLEVPTEVLDDLKEAGRFDLWELQGREVVLYWRDLAPRERCEVTLDLVARIPGTTTGPASRAYLYYTPQEKRWAEPVEVEVTPVR